MALQTETNLTEPRYEAAFFYGLFLRGYPLQQLRQDIDVPPEVLDRWKRMAVRDPWYHATVERILAYRKHVLAIFDSLVFQEESGSKQLRVKWGRLFLAGGSIEQLAPAGSPLNPAR